LIAASKYRYTALRKARQPRAGADDAELIAARGRLTAAKQETDRIEADTTTRGLGYRHPLLLAEEAALSHASDAFCNALGEIISLPAATDSGLES
jgi:hypothetical protein